MSTRIPAQPAPAIWAGQIYQGCKPEFDHVFLRILQVAGAKVQTEHLDGRFRRWTRVDYFHQAPTTKAGVPWRGGYVLLRTS